MNTKQLAAEAAEALARIATLRREIGMLRRAQMHLCGIPARHNLQRIAEREGLLQALLVWADLCTRDDAAEIEARAA